MSAEETVSASRALRIKARLARYVRRGLVICGLLVFCGVVYEQFMRWRVEQVYPPRGEMVEVGGRQVHVVQRGNNADPTVVFESGIGMPGSDSWGTVPTLVSEFAKCVHYDRAGLGCSERSGGKRSSRTIASELADLLNAMDVQQPVVLVAHSLGGHHVRVFADAYPEMVAGIVLVDVPQGEETMFPPKPGHLLSDPPAWAEPAFRFAAITGLARLAFGSDGFTKARGPQTTPTLIAEAKAIPDCFREVAETGSVGQRPLVVLSGRKTNDFDFPYECTIEERLELQAKLADLSSNSYHIVTDKSGHNIQHTEPELVVAAILAVLETSQTGESIAESFERL